MRKKKTIYKNIITSQGEVIDSKCANCDGDGVFVGDWEDDYKNMDIQICSLCEGYGYVTKDMIDRVDYDHEGNRHITYKETNNARRK